VTLTLTLDPAIRHTVVHHSSTSTYIPNFIQIEETFCGRTCGRTYGRTYGRTFFSPLILLGRLLEVDLKSSEATQRLRTGCSKAEPKVFASPHNPFLVTQDGQNLISWRWSPPSPTDPVWWRSMHAISSYHGNRPTNTHTQTGPITIHCTAKLSMQCNERNLWKP